MCLILFIVCNTQDDSVFYNIVRSAMAVNSFHDQIINFSWLNSCISQYYFDGDFLYLLKHMYIKIIGYCIFLLQFVWGFSHIDWTTTETCTKYNNLVYYLGNILAYYRYICTWTLSISKTVGHEYSKDIVHYYTSVSFCSDDLVL